MSPQLCTLALMAVLTLLLIVYVAARARACRAEAFTAGDGAATPSSRPYCEQKTHSCVACFTNTECGEMTPYCEGGRCVSACKPGEGGASCIDGACIDGITDSYCGATAVPRVLRDRTGAWVLEPTDPAAPPTSTTVDAATVGACLAAAQSAGAAAAMHISGQNKCVIYPSTEGISAVYNSPANHSYTSIALTPGPLLMCRDGVCQRCGVDADCGAGLRCIDGGRRCVQCGADADCGAGHRCVANVCAECGADADCGADRPYCTGGVCVPCQPGQPGGVCGPPTPFCLAGTSGATCAADAPLPRVGRGLRLAGVGGAAPPAPLTEATLSFGECLQAIQGMTSIVATQYDETTKNCAVYNDLAGLYVTSAARSAGEPAVYVFENSAVPRN